MEQLLALAAEAGRSIRHHSATLSQANLLAQIGFLVQAELALLALWRVQWNDVIADFEVDNRFADRFYDTGAFVAKNAWEKSFGVDSRERERIGVALEEE